ncbi:MAG: hypothetical protein US11_C0002G0031 [Candidatus Roizmanbacteria bacterium GW2011_GWA2_36_23]|uniref:Glycosyltransferase RgtA/B/C/D-like domain-containing protein n=1 Tax=Candidatus Roizmanbacteria bacterium GW2011_GWA2_36_23 TaxID=1618480 RepID=A0A0G0E8X6_9BACT|nr:MAG: hypothetical protein US11_C0002G0031 [Candidatus Roizmanbacteria bacterium GW2011_GWA2_36_23]
MPTYSGEILKGYNYLYDVLLLFLSKIGIPPIISYFKLMPIFWFAIFTYLLIVLAKKLNKNNIFVWFFLFFIYMAGSFSFFFTLVKDKTIWGSSGILAQLVQHMLLNHQFSLSLIPLVYILIKMREKNITFKWLTAAGIAVAINMGLKFYGGIVSYILVISYLLFVINKHSLRKSIVQILIISLFFIASVFIFYNPTAALKSRPVFIFSPFSFIHPISEDPGLLNMQKLTYLRYVVQDTRQYWKLFLIELFNLALFLFFYFGVRFFGLIFGTIKTFTKKSTPFDRSVILTVIASILFTTLFIQTGEWTNIVQFLYYGIFLSTVYLAELTYFIIKKKKVIGYLIVGLLMLFSVPSTIDVFALYAKFPGSAYLPKGEYEALQVLKKLPDGIVYSPLYNQSEFHRQQIKQLKEKGGPLPLYAWEDTSYVTAFSGKQHYLADLWMERIIGIDYKKRLEKVIGDDCSFLKEIDYIYYNNDYQISRRLFDCENKLEFVYGNLTSRIYRVIK